VYFNTFSAVEFDDLGCFWGIPLKEPR